MQCAHEGCTCQVRGAGDYCSDHCRQHEDHTAEMACQCGHPECAGTRQMM